MKLTVCEYKTTIEADAKELSSCNTVTQNFAAILSRCFQPHYEDECEDDCDAQMDGGNDV